MDRSLPRRRRLRIQACVLHHLSGLAGSTRGDHDPRSWHRREAARRPALGSAGDGGSAMKRDILVIVPVTVVLALATTVAVAITQGEPDAGRHPYVGLIVF